MFSRTCEFCCKFRFTFCKNLSDNGILLVAKHLHQLRNLSVLHCNAVTDISVRNLADYSASTLELLHLSAINFTRTALDYARGKCPKLKLQVVGDCTTQYDYKILHQTSSITHLSTHAQLSDTLMDNLGYCASVEVAYLHASQDAVLSMQGLSSLCEKWPS